MTRLAFVLFAALLAAPAHADTLTGTAVVHDGDTFRLDGQPVRLWGIDAPELGQSCQRPGGRYQCGVEARDALAEWIGQRDVICKPIGKKSWDRIVAVCWVPRLMMLGRTPLVRHRDIAAWLVMHGYAVDWPEYSSGFYASQQAAAMSEDAGIWAGKFYLPKSGIGGE